MSRAVSARRLVVVAMVAALCGASLAASSLGLAQTAQPAPTATEPPTKPSKGRHVAAEPTEIEVLNFVDEYERDPQAFAVGASGGVGALATKGSNQIVPGATFAFTFDFGLGPGGSRVPWSLEPFAAFAITPASFNSDVQAFPDRFTELGARIVYRGSGLLQGRFVSLGLGLVWTSWGNCSRPAPASCDNRHDLTPAGLVDVGFGLVEWTARAARYGIGVATPIEVSKHPGLAVFGFFYAQLGLGR